MDMNGLKIGLEGEIETEVTRRDTVTVGTKLNIEHLRALHLQV